jgi:hypothetical protein
MLKMSLFDELRYALACTVALVPVTLTANAAAKPEPAAATEDWQNNLSRLAPAAAYQAVCLHKSHGVWPWRGSWFRSRAWAEREATFHRHAHPGHNVYVVQLRDSLALSTAKSDLTIEKGEDQ